jgi:hypothetical protein
LLVGKSPSVYYLARFILSKFAFGLFLVFTGAALWHDFEFNWCFVAMVTIGAILIAYDLVKHFDKLKAKLQSLQSFRNFALVAWKYRAILGFVLAWDASCAYLFHGFQPSIFAEWALGIAICGHTYFSDRKVHLNAIARSDILILIALYSVSLPVYLWSVYSIPFHLNSDESILLCYEQEYITKGIVDVFGLSSYFGFMYFPFLFQGWLAHFLGGIDLYHVRLLNALAGTAIVAFSYIFFRVINLPRFLAIAATMFVCFNHSLVAISRILSRTNGGLLLELLALIALFEGLKKKCLFTTYLGGVLTGICFYAYYSARLTLPVWLLFLLLLFCFKQNSYTRREILRFLSVFLLSFALSVAPLIAAQIRQPDRMAEANTYQRRSCLLYPEGRRLATEAFQKQGGIARNIFNGLAIFNSDRYDGAYIYMNPGHGFLDPVSGVLLWLGLIVIFPMVREDLTALFVVSAFLFEYLTYSLIAFPNPNYTRALVMLPFVGYFVACGMNFIAISVTGSASKFGQTFPEKSRYFLIAGLALFCAGLNATIFYGFAQKSAIHGDDIGGTARYLEARKGSPNQLFVVICSSDYPYYAGPTNVADYFGACRSNVEPYVSPGQETKVFAPNDLETVQLVPPFSLFMNDKLWQAKQTKLNKMYPHLVVHRISDNPPLVAIENPATVPATSAACDQYRAWDSYPEIVEDAFWQTRYSDVEKLGQHFLNSPSSAITGSYCRARVLGPLGAAWLNLQKRKEAEKALLEAYELYAQLWGECSDDTAQVACNLGQLYGSLKNWPTSERWYETSIDIKNCVMADQSTDWCPGLVYAYWHMAESQRKQHKFELAEKTYRRAIELCRTDRDENDYRRAIKAELAACIQEQNQPHKGVLP